MARRKSKKPSGMFKYEIEMTNWMWLDEFKQEAKKVGNYFRNIEIFLSFKDFTNKPFNL